MVNAPFEESKQHHQIINNQFRNKEFLMQKSNIKSDKRHFSRSYNKHETMATADPHASGNTANEAPPIVAIVTPTTRPPPNTNNSNNATSKTGGVTATIHPQAQQQPTLMHTTAYRLQGVPHHHLSPIQLTATALSPPPPIQQASTSGVQIAAQPGTGAAVWSMVEPIFHFGPGFELHQSYCPTHSQSNPTEHIVLFHLMPGVAVSFQIGGSRKIIRGPTRQKEVNWNFRNPGVQLTGPVTVPMVSQSGSPPIPMPVQVPPGHVMQQIVDENGTLRHVILSTAQHQQLQGQTSSVHSVHHMQHYIPNGTTPQFYNPIATVPGFPPGNAPPGPGTTHYHPLQSGGGHLQPQPVSHSPSPPNNSYHKDERSARQHMKLQRKLDARNVNQVQANRNNKNSDLNGLGRRNHQRNGTSSGGSVGGGASSVGTSDDGEESSSVPDEEDEVQPITDFLSSVESPIIKEITSRTALITWEPPQPTTENSLVNNNDLHYEILLGDRGKEGKYKSIFRGTTLSCKIQDLRPGQEYHVRLVVHYLENFHGQVSDPAVFKTPPCEPDTPLGPKLLMRTKNSLQLRWNAPCDNGAHILNYILECNTGNNGEFVEVCKIKGKQFTVTKLQPSIGYSFRLQAINECGRSEYSEIVQYFTAGNPPSAPQNPLMTKNTSSSITLVWTRRREDGDYVLQMAEGKSKAYLNVYVGPENIYECVRLHRATPYQFRLRTDNEAGHSPWSEEVTYYTLPESPGRPSKPQVKGKIHANYFKVKWDPPHDRGGAEIKFYHLEISSGAVFERIYSGPEPEAICDRLSPGTTYQIRVICESQGGVSISSDICTVTTEAVVPNSPQTPYCNKQPGPYAAVLQWEKPLYQGGAPVTEYELELEGVLNDGSERKTQRVIVYRGKESCCVVKDLFPGETYVVRVRAVNRIGAGNWSDEFTFKAGSAPPNKPQVPDVNIRSPTHLLVQWKEPQCNGSPITDYKLESSQKPNEDDGFSLVYEGVETSVDLRNLSPFTTYHFRLFAINSAGRSPYSPVVTTQTPAAAPNVPSFQPDLFEITANTALLHWKEPECNGSPITHYLVECGDRTLNANDTKLLIEHLSPEQMYKVKVQAVNSIGSGPFSQFQKILTKPLPPKPPKLECIQYGYNSLKLKWGSEVNNGSNSASGNPNANAKSSSNLMDFQRFYVDMKIKNSSKDYQNIYTGTRNSIKVQKLHESTVYSFRICAQTDHAGIGPYSDEYLFKTQAAQPSSVKIIRITEINPVINSNNSNEQHVTALPGLIVDWQHSKNNHFNDSVEYILQRSVMATGTNKNQQFDEIYRGPETRYTIESIEYDTEYFFRVTPVRVMRSKRTTSVCSSSTRSTSRDDLDEVDNPRHSEDEDTEDDDDEMSPKVEIPVTYEYVYGTSSSVIKYKLPKSSESPSVTSTINIGGSGRSRSNTNKPQQTGAVSKRQQPQLGKQIASQKQTALSAESEEQSEEEEETNNVVSRNLLLMIWDKLLLFYYDRSKLSTRDEGLIILAFSFLAAILFCYIIKFLNLVSLN